MLTMGLTMAPVVLAEEVTECVTVTQYGNATGVVCGAKHEPVEAGLADINPIVLASIFFTLAGASLVKAKKVKRAEVVL